MSYIPPKIDGGDGDDWGVVHSGPVPEDRLSKIAWENGLDPKALRPLWVRPVFRPDRDLFDAKTGAPRFTLSVDVWKPVVRAYFAWCRVRREQCTNAWSDIVDLILRRSREESISDAFKAWAYGCLCIFLLEDRKKKETEVEGPGGYDPDNNWKCN